VVSVDDAANQAFYGHAVTPPDILIKHSASNPAGDALAHDVARAASGGH
jgi:lipid-binding SYLF domain-containing protein